MEFNFTDQEFLDLLKRKQNQILDKTKDFIQESAGFKILFAGLKSMLKNNAFKGQRVIFITEEDIMKIELSNIRDFNDLFKSDEFTLHQKITLDLSLQVIKAERCRFSDDSGEVRRELTELSSGGLVVFLLLHDKINYIIGGTDKTESPFFSLTDMNKYNAKKEINEIGEVFSAYNEALKERRNYSKFFIELSHLKSLRVDLSARDDEKTFIFNHKHLLRNKPEDSFRDDLREFLTFNLRVSQVKEYLLENMRRLDIYLYDEYGEIYLIEVKWVGESVHQDGKKLGTSYELNDINPEAFKQALDYLEELDNKGQNIVRAYLVVFDGRKDDLEDTGTNFDEKILSDIQKKHYRKFSKISDIRVLNKHPN